MLRKKFSMAGVLHSVQICNESGGTTYALVNFEKHIDAEQALYTMNFDVMKGRPINITWYQTNPKLRLFGGGNVFVKNLDLDIGKKLALKNMTYSLVHTGSSIIYPQFFNFAFLQ